MSTEALSLTTHSWAAPVTPRPAPCGNYEGTRSGAAYGDDPCRFLKGVRGRPSLAWGQNPITALCRITATP